MEILFLAPCIIKPRGCILTTKECYYICLNVSACAFVFQFFVCDLMMKISAILRIVEIKGFVFIAAEERYQDNTIFSQRAWLEGANKHAEKRFPPSPPDK